MVEVFLINVFDRDYYILLIEYVFESCRIVIFKLLIRGCRWEIVVFLDDIDILMRILFFMIINFSI